MRLFSVPSGTVDRKTRAWLLTQPFDLAFDAPVEEEFDGIPFYVKDRQTAFLVTDRKTNFEVPSGDY